MVSPEALRRHPFFAGLNEDQLRGIAMLSHEVSYPAGTLIVREGDPATKVYVLTGGSVNLFFEIEGPHGGEAYVGSVVMGEPFDTPALFEPARVVCSARAETDVCVVEMDAAGLLAMFAVDARLGYAVMLQAARILAERLNGTRLQLVAKPVC